MAADEDFIITGARPVPEEILRRKNHAFGDVELRT